MTHKFTLEDFFEFLVVVVNPMFWFVKDGDWWILFLALFLGFTWARSIHPFHDEDDGSQETNPVL